MDDDLVEKVARAICGAYAPTPGWSCGRACVDCKASARAAIAIVWNAALERAATEAESGVRISPRYMWIKGYMTARADAADAIRALKMGEGER